MPGSANAAAAKMARAQLTRRPVDCSQLSLSVGQTNIHITGVIRPLKGHAVDLNEEMNLISEMLRQRMHVQTVTWDVVKRV